jgi:hypothetical protein
VGKYGTNLEGFGAFEGGVNADKGAPLVSTSSDGETALLFGPAALREIQAGVANGDFAIPPDAAGDTITVENPLPYWTFTDVNSAGAITCAIVADAGAGSGNVLRWSIAASTTTGKSAKITRFVPIAGTANRAFAYLAEATFKASATTTSLKNVVTMQYYKGDGVTTTGTAVSNESTFSTSQRTINLNLADPNVSPPADAAFALITITTSTHSTTPASITTSDVYEVGLYNGGSLLVVAENTSPSTYYPAVIKQTSGVLFFDPALSIQISGNVQLSARTGSTGDLTAAGNITATGNITAGGANSLWLSRASVASAAQSLTNNTSTTILLDTASTTPTTGTYDPKSWFNNANDRIAVGQAGFYCVTANIAFAANATGRRTLTIAVNGADAGSVNVLAAPAGSTILSVSTNLYLAAGDLVTMTALQQSGGALNTVVVAGVYPALSLGRIGA